MSSGERVEILNNTNLPERPEKYHCAIPVRVTGIKAGPVLSASTAEALAFEPAVSCSSLGNQQTAVILLNFSTQNLNADWTMGNANSFFFGPANSVASYVAEVSHNKASVSGQVFGPYTITTNETCNPNPFDISTAALSVIGNSIDLTGFQRLFYIIPMRPSCPFRAAGVSSIGCSTIALPGAPTNRASVAQASVNEDFAFTSGLDVFTHEYGHSLGTAARHFPGLYR